MGCYNEITQTVELINNRNLFLTALESEKTKIKVPADSVPGEKSFSGLWMAAISLCPRMVEEKNKLLYLFVQGHQFHHEGHPWPISKYHNIFQSFNILILGKTSKSIA